MTHTYAILQISRAAWDEIHRKLVDAGYRHAHHEDDVVDMHGIAVQPIEAEKQHEFTPVPEFAKDYPQVAELIGQVRLPFYCCNCLRKRPTRYLTPNFGPFCEECLKELEK